MSRRAVKSIRIIAIIISLLLLNEGIFPLYTGLFLAVAFVTTELLSGSNLRTIKNLTMNKLSFDDWYDLHEDEINIELAENGADREMDFDSEKEFEKKYQKYLDCE